jgi:hypothetical protein
MKKGFLTGFATIALVLVVFLSSRYQAAPPAPQAPASGRTYVGSAACRNCHASVYERWAKTRMANVVTDPHVRPQVIIPDFSKADPLLTFKLDDVALVYGTKWKQRYFRKVGNDYFPLPAQWDVNHSLWRAYMVQPNTDWWVPFYPADNNKRPTGPLCDGCHSVNFNIRRKPSQSGTSDVNDATARAANMPPVQQL